MELTITPEVEALIEQQLKGGRFRGANELIATALHVLSDTTPQDLRELDLQIQEGLDSIDRGELYSESEARSYLSSIRAKL